MKLLTFCMFLDFHLPYLQNPVEKFQKTVNKPQQQMIIKIDEERISLLSFQAHYSLHSFQTEYNFALRLWSYLENGSSVSATELELQRAYSLLSSKFAEISTWAHERGRSSNSNLINEMKKKRNLNFFKLHQLSKVQFLLLNFSHFSKRSESVKGHLINDL